MLIYWDPRPKTAKSQQNQNSGSRKQTSHLYQGPPNSGPSSAGLYQGPPNSGPISAEPVSMKIPRPKHCSRNSDLFQSSSDNGNGEEFHSDNYLQAATKNKRRTSRLSSADLNNHTAVISQKRSSSSPAGIKLKEMYSNGAFKD